MLLVVVSVVVSWLSVVDVLLVVIFWESVASSSVSLGFEDSFVIVSVDTLLSSVASLELDESSVSSVVLEVSLVSNSVEVLLSSNSVDVLVELLELSSVDYSTVSSSFILSSKSVSISVLLLLLSSLVPEELSKVVF